MDTLQTGVFDALYNAIGKEEIAEAMRGLGNCEAKKLHRGPVAILMKAGPGRRDATLTVARYPSKPETLATEEPSNGYAADFIGKVRIRGWLELDQGIVGGGGGIANFEQLLALFPVGFRMPWHDKDNIPTGWAIMDGVANASGSGIDRGGKVGYGYLAGDPVFGTMNADVSAALSAPIIGDGGTTSVTINNANLVTDVDPNPHVHTVSATTANIAQGEGTSDTTVVVAVNSDTGAVDLAVSIDPHNHTATVSNDTLANTLAIDTPTTVRPPGVVELWIEKLA